MQKVVIIHNRLVVGGPAVAIAETIKKLNHQFEFFLIVGKPLKDEMDASYLVENLKNLTIIHLNEMGRLPNVMKDVFSYYKLKKMIRNINPQVVHTHGAKSGLIGRLVAKNLSVPKIIHTYHGHIFHSYFNKLVSSIIIKTEQFLANKTDTIIVLSEYLKNEIVEKYKICNAKKVEIIPLSLDLSSFSIEEESKRNAFRNFYHVQNGQTAIGIVGRITAIKNMKYFAQVIIALQSNENFKDLKFFIVGDGDEKKEIENYLIEHKIIISNGVDNSKNASVIFTSWIKNMDEVMNGLDIVCLTSLNEGTPVCLIEAMANKKPIVTTNAGSIPEMIENGVSGFVVNDKNEFIQKLMELVNNSSLQKEFGTNGLHYIQKTYLSNVNMVKMQNIYLN